VSVTDKLIKNGINPMSAQALKRYQSVIQEAGNGFTIPSARYLSTQKALDYINTGAWKEKMMRWGSGYYERTYNIFENGMRNGWSPKYTAARLREVANNIPYRAAENLTRTLQLTAYRDAALSVEKINGGFIQYKIRICALKPTSCLACISLHGTRLEVGERVDDHYSGFCSVPGKRNFVKWQTGEEWFAGLSPERQAQQSSFANSPAKLKAYRDGLPLSTFVTEHTDPVFGRQVTEGSLLKVLGQTEAEQYYTRNQP
jgi:hypothetical protein